MRLLVVTAVSSTTGLIIKIFRHLRERGAVALQASGICAIRQLLRVVMRISRLGLLRDLPPVYISEVHRPNQVRTTDPLIRLFLTTKRPSAGAEPLKWPEIENDIQARCQEIAWEKPDLSESLQRFDAESLILPAEEVYAVDDQWKIS